VDQLGGGRSDPSACAAARCWWAANIGAAGLPMMFMGTEMAQSGWWDTDPWHGALWANAEVGGLDWAGLGWAGLGWAGLGWAGLGWAGLGWAGLAKGTGPCCCWPAGCLGHPWRRAAAAPFLRLHAEGGLHHARAPAANPSRPAAPPSAAGQDRARVHGGGAQRQPAAAGAPGAAPRLVQHTARGPAQRCAAAAAAPLGCNVAEEAGQAAAPRLEVVSLLWCTSCRRGGPCRLRTAPARTARTARKAPHAPRCPTLPPRCPTAQA
jgi:hypothetical protein